MSETLSHIALKQISPIQEEYFTILNDVEISVDERNLFENFRAKTQSRNFANRMI